MVQINAARFVDIGRIALAVGLINWPKPGAGSSRQRYKTHSVQLVGFHTSVFI